MFTKIVRFNKQENFNPSPTLGWDQLPSEWRSQLEALFVRIPELQELAQKGIRTRDSEGAWHLWLGENSDQQTRDQGVKAQAWLGFGKTSGLLREYRFTNPEWADGEIPSGALVREKALEVAQLLLGERLKDYQMEDKIDNCRRKEGDGKEGETRWLTGILRFVPLHNGLPLLRSQGLQVEVNGLGRVCSFSWFEGLFEGSPDEELDGSLFPDPAMAISLEQADLLRAERLSMALEYHQRFPLAMPPWGRGDGSFRGALIYEPVHGSDNPLDGISGEPINLQYGMVSSSIFTTKLIGQGNNQGVQNRREAEDFLCELDVDVTGLEFAESIGVHPFYLERSMVMYSWGNRGPGAYRIWMHIDPDSGKSLIFKRRFTPEFGGKVVITEEEARSKAFQLVEKHLIPEGVEGLFKVELSEYPVDGPIPEWVDEEKLREKLREIPEMPKMYNYCFYRIHQGIPVEDRNIRVELDGEGRLVTLKFDNLTKDLSSLPDAAEAVSPEKAKEVYIQNHPLQLVYDWPRYKDQRAPAPRLVYIPKGKDSGYIDALTGAYVSFADFPFSD